MKKYLALRIVGVVYRVLAWITLVGGVLAGIATMVTTALGRPSTFGPRLAVASLAAAILMGLAIVLGALLSFVVLSAVADAVHLGLSIEQNTREMATYLKGGTGAPVK